MTNTYPPKNLIKHEVNEDDFDFSPPKMVDLSRKMVDLLGFVGHQLSNTNIETRWSFWPSKHGQADLLSGGDALAFTGAGISKDERMAG